MFGNTLRKLRMIYGISAKEFSELLGISTAFLSAIETGRKEPSVEFSCQVCRRFRDQPLGTGVAV